MRQNIIYGVLLVFACSFQLKSPRIFPAGQLQEIRVLKLPFSVRCDNFINVSSGNSKKSFYGRAEASDKIIVLTNRINESSPLLFVIDKEGKVTDSLRVFEKACYCVTKIKCCEPWLKIANDLHITVTDTTYYTKGGVDTTKGKTTYLIDYIPKIEQKKYQISKSGKIVRL